MTTKPRQRVVRSTAAAVFLLALALAISGVALGVRAVPVLTGSMDPQYAAGSLTITTRTDPGDVAVGDVVAFRPPSEFATVGSRPILHRVVSLEERVDGIFVTTKGDANPAADPWVVRLDALSVQQAHVAIPWAGRAVQLLTSSAPEARSLLVVGIVMLAGAVVCWPRRECDCLAPSLRVHRL